MSIKDEVLKQLEENKGEYISGGQLATNLNVSRNSIWKAIKTLEKDGYSINAIPNKGYCLEPDNDILSPQSIEQYLNYPLDLSVYKTITSTNTVLKEKAEQSAPHAQSLSPQNRHLAGDEWVRNSTLHQTQACTLAY
jgi:BirA family biotin operon repressor/biotin-[acetyl-CoA-carboxylase] ligase